MALATSRLILSMIGRGVFAGAIKANQFGATMPGRPASLNVGTSGSAGIVGRRRSPGRERARLDQFDGATGADDGHLNFVLRDCQHKRRGASIRHMQHLDLGEDFSSSS